ncbi:type IV secretion protein Rhs [Streptomyces venezuelae]|uniref:Type IV secretion protein Rhs n=1 Tax=Streptomyces venezuelae TaxID=54571 RepID=A0A5P2DDR9_STRVZ|nr:type IV secretion protein Rhs [Streptomyces venezuelae]
MNSTVTGLAVAANDPLGTAKNMVDAFQKDPAEGLGKLIPEILGTKGLGMAKKAATVGKFADNGKGPARTADQGTDGPKGGKHDQCDGERKCDGTDPVDLATGRMFLPLTDLVLPGTLPLAFTRRAESGYTAGRWFGPTWTSTVDQHLETDAEGVVLVTEDGLILPYPHPAPGLPVCSAKGPRWELSRTPEGGYLLTDPDAGRVRHFEPDCRNGRISRISRITDRNGNSIDFEYDAEGAPTAIRHSGGYHLLLDTADGRITRLSLAGAGRVLEYGYTDGHLTEVINSSGRPLRFAYDERGRITSWTDTNGSTYGYAYDEFDRCVREGGEAGHYALDFEYGTDPGTGRQVTVTRNAAGHTRRYQMNEARQVVAETGALGAVTHSRYDRRNRLLSRTDPLGRTTEFHRDADGRLVRVVRPDGRELTTEYDAMGRPVLQTRADRTTWRLAYDSRGNRIALTNPAGATTRYEYDDHGHPTSVTDHLGGTTRIRTNPAGLPVEITDPLGAVTRYERDAFGRAVRITDALGGETLLEWTPEGRLARRVEADGTVQEWTYDGEGNALTHRDPMGGLTSFEYGHFDAMTARTGPDGVRYAFARDAELRLTEISGPLGRWTWEYDAAGLPAAETDYDGRTVRFGHDAAGRLTARTDSAGRTTRYGYDALDRRVEKETEGAVTRYEYDLSDRLSAVTGPDSRIEYARDRHGRIRVETVDGRTLRRDYDDLGRVRSRTTPAGAVSTWTYDEAGRRTELLSSGRRITFGRDALGRETGRRIGESLAMENTHDALGRLVDSHVRTSEGRTLQRRGYSYRPDGGLVAIDDLLAGRREFELDAAGRVTAARAEDWTEQYTYNAAGNQAAASWPARHPGGTEAVGERVYEGTRLVRAGAVRYEHDELGRVTLRQKKRLSRRPDTWHYTWDAEDRLAAVRTPDGAVWQYTYDPLGRRTSKRRLGADGAVLEETRFAWDGTTLCEQSTTTAGAPGRVTLTWDHDGLQPLAQFERRFLDEEETDQRFFAIVTDLIGTPRELIGEEGEVAWRAGATVWGSTAWNTDATAYTPLRFPGQYADPETGLHYNHFRHYDPETARYITPDPLGVAPTPNPSAYVVNPFVWSDSLGLAPDAGDCPKVGKTKEEQKQQALRDAGIPEGTEPFDVDDWVSARGPEWAGSKQLLDPDGKPIYYTEEWYEHPNGDIIVYQDHWFGHQTPGEPGYQPPHLHVRPYDDTRNGQIEGAEEHYYYDRE